MPTQPAEALSPCYVRRRVKNVTSGSASIQAMFRLPWQIKGGRNDARTTDQKVGRSNRSGHIFLM
jgi:hypothetical protein